jgi:hypothetical protein
MRIEYSTEMSRRIGPGLPLHQIILRNRTFLLFAFSMLALLSPAVCDAAPNVLFIVADDLN